MLTSFGTYYVVDLGLFPLRRLLLYYSKLLLFIYALG